MKQHASANVPRLLAGASPEARRKWERNVDVENLVAYRIVEAELRASMARMDPGSDEFWRLKDRLAGTRMEIRNLKTRLYGKALAVLGFVVYGLIAFGAGLLVGWGLL